MRDVQRAALPLFRADGFDAVTVEQIASEVGTAASTVYRHFGSKEQIVLWDEHDIAIDEALAGRLGRQPPLSAIRDVFVETLAGRYDEDLAFQLARIQFIYATPQVHGAAVEQDLRNRHALAEGLRGVLPTADRPAADLMAGCALLALDLAIEAWQAADAETPLADLILARFETLTQLERFA
ncbi:TetR/AcrR family transcriptional regulator [Euzebya tangerina]|uniref:TetR/AcrR family transcriptional regulator n=1 Tax=Euzebya tangerina TaxID=591198 RepID=UPI00196A7F9D|nr:TetR/AcrR family transcriptional regulator [Euzebya tangerina]